MSTPNRNPRRLPWRRSTDASQPPDGGGASKLGVGRWLRREIGELFNHEEAATTGPSGSSSLNVGAGGKDLLLDDIDCPPDISMESCGDLRYYKTCFL